MDNHKLPISKINQLFKNKELKPSELYSEVFERAANTESVIHGHLTLFQEENIQKALDADKRYEKGNNIGTLDGIPIAIKDNINISGQLLVPQKCYQIISHHMMQLLLRD